MKKALLVGNFGSGNRGDELILRGVLHLCDELKWEPVVLSNNPAETRKLYGVHSLDRLPFGFRSFFRFSWLKTVKAFMASDICILGGGGLFVDVFRMAPVLWFMHGYLAILLGKPLIMLGHSFDVRRGFSRFLLTYLLVRARVVTVRDEYSLNLARELGIASEKLFLFPDLSFLAELSFSSEKKDFLAVSLCRWGISDSAEKAIVNFLNDVLNSSDTTYIRFFVFQSAHDDDLPVMQKIAALLPVHSYEFVYVDDTLFEYKFSECRVGLVMRLHALFLSYRSKTPFIALAYQSKVRHSMLDFGLVDFCLSVDEVTSSELMKLFHESLSQSFVFNYPVFDVNALVDVVSSSIE